MRFKRNLTVLLLAISETGWSDRTATLLISLVFISVVILFPVIHFVYSVTHKNSAEAPSTDPHPVPSYEKPKAVLEPEPELVPKSEAEPEAEPEIVFRLILLPDPGISPRHRCRDTCRYLWHEALVIRSASTPTISNDACICLWSALFYTAVKTIRSQDSVRRIYSYFTDTLMDFITEEHRPEAVIFQIRKLYRHYQPGLNQCGIDPRTVNGRLQLWNYLLTQCPELLSRADIRHRFLSASQRVWFATARAFPQSHPLPRPANIKYSISPSEDQNVRFSLDDGSELP